MDRATEDEQVEDEDPKGHQRCGEQIGEDSRDTHRVGVDRMSLLRTEREVEMQMQVDMPVLLLLLTTLLLTWFKPLALASRLVT